MQRDFIISAMGDSAIRIQLNDKIEINTHLQIKAIAQHLEQNSFKGMVEYVPGFNSITVFYDPWKLIKERVDYIAPYKIIEKKIRSLLASCSMFTEDRPRVIEIPVCYGDDFGPDLSFVARYNKLSEEEVVQIHESKENRVYLLGFVPGFPYLGGMSEKIATPRKETPSLSIPAGSVGIAGKQTGIYPIEIPGGWQIIGKTPLKIFRPQEEEPSLLKVGDIVKFKSITRDEYEEILCKEGEE